MPQEEIEIIMRLKSKLKNTGLKFLNVNNVTDTLLS